MAWDDDDGGWGDIGGWDDSGSWGDTDFSGSDVDDSGFGEDSGESWDTAYDAYSDVAESVFHDPNTAGPTISDVFFNTPWGGPLTAETEASANESLPGTGIKGFLNSLFKGLTVGKMAAGLTGALVSPALAPMAFVAGTAGYVANKYGAFSDLSLGTGEAKGYEGKNTDEDGSPLSDTYRNAVLSGDKVEPFEAITNTAFSKKDRGIPDFYSKVASYIKGGEVSGAKTMNDVYQAILSRT